MMSLKFHNTLCAIIVDVAKLCGERRVVLTGGCFQNKYLTERTITMLRAEGFLPYWHQRVPPNDGGIALGQIYACMRSERTPHINDADGLLARVIPEERKEAACVSGDSW